VLLLAALLGCGGGAVPGDPVTSADPSASAQVLGEAELAVCDGTIRMDQGVTRLRSVRLRRGAGGNLVGALDLVLEGQRLVEEYAPSRMRTRVRTLGFAVSNVVIAVEDFRTTDRQQVAASNIRRRTNALRRSIEGFREWVGCPDPGAGAPARAPEATPGG
jgi:hypothetical protein